MADGLWVMLDTDVWSEVFVKKKSTERAAEWKRRLVGHSVVVATQTRAEVLSGLAWKDLGEHRRAAITAQLDSTPTVPVNNDVVLAFADLTGDCRRAGHALAEKVHTGDRWVAASSIATGIPLLAGDAIYRGAPHLSLHQAPAA